MSTVTTQPVSDKAAATDQPIATPIASVIVPACNESAVVGNCLRALTRTMRPGELEIIVVCNGCTDHTADVARSVSPNITVIETDTPGKANALNLGDDHAQVFPRFYVDADVVMTTTSIRRATHAINTSEAEAVAPRNELLLKDCSWAVRAFFLIWKQLPYYRNEPVGAGGYGVSRTGRARFDEFPNLLAEDDYVNFRIGRSQRIVARDAWFRTSPPKTLWALIKVRARHQRGRLQLRDRYPQVWNRETRSYKSAASELLSRPRLWLPVFMYALTFAITRLMGWSQYRFKTDPMRWDRLDEDHSSGPAPELPDPTAARTDPGPPIGG